MLRLLQLTIGNKEGGSNGPLSVCGCKIPGKHFQGIKLLIFVAHNERWGGGQTALLTLLKQHMLLEYIWWGGERE